MKSATGLFAAIKRIEVCTAGEYQAVDAFERVDDNVGIVYWWYDNRHSTCLFHRFVVKGGESLFAVGIIGGKTDYRTPCRFRKSVVYLVYLFFPVEFVVHNYSSTFTAISLLILCSSEMRVSVATTPGMSCSCPLSRCMSCSLSRAYSFTSMV